MTKRTALLKEYVVNQLNQAGVRTSKLYERIAASLKQSEGEALPLRRAKVSADLYDQIGMVIHPYEILVGSQLEMYPVDEYLSLIHISMAAAVIRLPGSFSARVWVRRPIRFQRSRNLSLMKS